MSSPSSARLDPTLPLDVAVMNAKAMSDLLHDLTLTCFDKCVRSFEDTELKVGEQTCLDRCSAKYIALHEDVGRSLQGGAAAPSPAAP